MFFNRFSRPPADTKVRNLTKLVTEDVLIIDNGYYWAVSFIARKLNQSGSLIHFFNYAMTRKIMGGKVTGKMLISNNIYWRFTLAFSAPFFYLMYLAKKYLINKRSAKKSNLRLVEKMMNILYEESGGSGKLINNS